METFERFSGRQFGNAGVLHTSTEQIEAPNSLSANFGESSIICQTLADHGTPIEYVWTVAMSVVQFPKRKNAIVGRKRIPDRVKIANGTFRPGRQNGHQP